MYDPRATASQFGWASRLLVLGDLVGRRGFSDFFEFFDLYGRPCRGFLHILGRGGQGFFHRRG